jgi:hypothetical protein
MLISVCLLRTNLQMSMLSQRNSSLQVIQLAFEPRVLQVNVQALWGNPICLLASQYDVTVPVWCYGPGMKLQSQYDVMVPVWSCSPSMMLRSQYKVTVPVWCYSPSMMLWSQYDVTVPVWSYSPSMKLQSQYAVMVAVWSCSPSMMLRSQYDVTGERIFPQCLLCARLTLEADKLTV